MPRSAAWLSSGTAWGIQRTVSPAIIARIHENAEGSWQALCPLAFHRLGFPGSSSFLARCDRIAAIVGLASGALGVSMRAVRFNPLKKAFINGRLEHVTDHTAQLITVWLHSAPQPLMDIVSNFRFLFGA
jgi:hypothetical protein